MRQAISLTMCGFGAVATIIFLVMGGCPGPEATPPDAAAPGATTAPAPSGSRAAPDPSAPDPAPIIDAPPSPDAAATPGAAADPAVATTWQGMPTVRSALGTYTVAYRLRPTDVPLNELFGVDLWIFDGDDVTDIATPRQDVELTIDGRMPDHRHGMNRAPTIARNDRGGFAVTGMLFHMPGYWELHFDVTEGAVTERAQVVVELE